MGGAAWAWAWAEYEQRFQLGDILVHLLVPHRLAAVEAAQLALLHVLFPDGR